MDARLDMAAQAKLIAALRELEGVKATVETWRIEAERWRAEAERLRDELDALKTATTPPDAGAR